MRAIVFHNVVAGALDPFDRTLERLDAGAFRREIEFLRRRYELVALPEALARLDAGDPARRALVLTFDDGFLGVHEVARPILEECGAVGVVFVLTDPSGLRRDRLFHYEELEIAFRSTTVSAVDLSWASGGRAVLSTTARRVRVLQATKRWLKRQPESTRRTAHARLLDMLEVDPAAIALAGADHKYRKLGVDECRDLQSAGWTIGGHSRTHPSLGLVTAEDLAGEVGGNARDLSALGFAPGPFAYPYGDGPHVTDAVRMAARRAGFSCAFTTVPGENGPSTDQFALHRFTRPKIHQSALRRRLGG